MAINRLVTRSQLAKCCQGCGKTFVYDNCQRGGLLYPAMVGDKVNLDHKAARVFMVENDYVEPDLNAVIKAAQVKNKSQTPRNRNRNRTPAEVEPEPMADHEDDPEAAAWMDMSLRELVHRYGKQAQFKDYVTAAKNLAQLEGIQEKNARERGEYIHRSQVERLVVYLDTLNDSLLTDAVVNMATAVAAMVRADAPKVEIEAAMRDTISRSIRGTKEQVTRAVRDV